MVNMEPLPGSLVKVTSPPIIRQKFFVMARPRPVPPKSRVVEASAWANVSNTRACCSGVMPMPVSLTRKIIQSPLWEEASRAASSVIFPFFVNLLALLRRLNKAWRTLVMSAFIAPRFGGQCISIVFEFFWTSNWTVALMSSSKLGISKVSRYNSILPASILDKSSTSLINSSKCLPARLIFLRSGMKLSCPVSCASS